MTDLDLIQYAKEEADKDAKFTGRKDAEYKAFQYGQVVGVKRLSEATQDTKALYKNYRHRQGSLLAVLIPQAVPARGASLFD
jgi:hypothetical protein